MQRPWGRSMVGNDPAWSNLASCLTRLNVNRRPIGLSASTNIPFSTLPLPILCIAATMVFQKSKSDHVSSLLKILINKLKAKVFMMAYRVLPNTPASTPSKLNSSYLSITSDTLTSSLGVLTHLTYFLLTALIALSACHLLTQIVTLLTSHFCFVNCSISVV